MTPGDVLGTVRIRATATDPTKDVFIGVAPQAQVDAYLAGAAHLRITDWIGHHASNVATAGGAPATAPTAAKIWAAQAAGSGTQTVTWRPTSGRWVIVVMNTNGNPGVSIAANVGAAVPDLAWIAAGLFAIGGLLLAGAVVLIAIPVVRAGR